jgi:hypothetical protein
MLPETNTASPRANAPVLSRIAMPAVASATHPPPSVNAESVKATPPIVAIEPSISSRASAIGIGFTGAGVGVGSMLGVGLGVGVGVGIGVGVGLADGVGESVGSCVRLGVGDAVGVGVEEADGEGVLIGATLAFCGSGAARTTKSAALSFVSSPDPACPPGNRSRLEPAGGAAAGVPSSHVLVALPQPSASMAVVAPWMRSATLPPVAARPLAYVASAIGA